MQSWCIICISWMLYRWNDLSAYSPHFPSYSPPYSPYSPYKFVKRKVRKIMVKNWHLTNRLTIRQWNQLIDDLLSNHCIVQYKRIVYESMSDTLVKHDNRWNCDRIDWNDRQWRLMVRLMNSRYERWDIQYRQQSVVIVYQKDMIGINRWNTYFDTVCAMMLRYCSMMWMLMNDWWFALSHLTVLLSTRWYLQDSMTIRKETVSVCEDYEWRSRMSMRKSGAARSADNRDHNLSSAFISDCSAMSSFQPPLPHTRFESQCVGAIVLEVGQKIDRGGWESIVDLGEKSVRDVECIRGIRRHGWFKFQSCCFCLSLIVCIGVTCESWWRRRRSASVNAMRVGVIANARWERNCWFIENVTLILISLISCRIFQSTISQPWLSVHNVKTRFVKESDRSWGDRNLYEPQLHWKLIISHRVEPHRLCILLMNFLDA